MICSQCGKQNSEHAKFCDECGAVLKNSPHHHLSLNDYTDYNKIIFVLSYLGVLFFLPLVLCPESKEGRFHANQSLVLLIAGIVGQIVLSILSTTLWVLWILWSLLTAILGLVILAWVITGMINAYKGKQKPLPIIGNIKILN